MKTYEEAMRERLEDGRGPRVVQKEVAPGVKDILAGKVRNNGASSVTGTSQASVPAVSMPAVLKGKDLYENSHIYNYDDPYRGELDRQREAIENRGPFSYDYREDDVYETIRRLKEKEAQKAYNDGYAQLSTQFDGDIPVNMINKLLTTKGEIVDQADSYIPTLRQMAYQMYQDEGDRMYQNYGLTQNAAAEDYARWSADRDFVVRGNENKYARDFAREQFDYSKERDAVGDAWNREQFDYGKLIDDRNYNYQLSRDAIDDIWKQKYFDEEKRQFNKLNP